VQLSGEGTPPAVSHVTSLSVAPGAVLDLTSNKLITASAVGMLGSGNTYTGVTGLIQSGRNGGASGKWTGSGIVTSQTLATSGNLTGIGVATAAQAKDITATQTALWAGQTVTGSDTLIMYTYGGDANLDGKVDFDDYGRIDFNVASGTSGWSNGDFNYDGKINVDDYGIIDFNFPIQGAPFSTTIAAMGSREAGGARIAALLSVPEPGIGVAMFAVAGATLSAQRRRREPRHGT